MHDFRCTSPVDMYYPVLAKQVRFFKETEGGLEIMCRAFEELAEKRANERELETKKEIAKNMLKDGSISMEKVAMLSELPITVVEELANLQLA